MTSAVPSTSADGTRRPDDAVWADERRSLEGMPLPGHSAAACGALVSSPRDLLENLRIALVGANGFIGRSLARALAGSPGVDLTLISRTLTEAFFARHCPDARLVPLDFGETERAAEVCAEADVIVDLVTSETPRSLSAGNIERVYNVSRQHCRFYEQLSRLGRKHVIFLSSGGAVYGASAAERIGEDHPTRPTSGYGLAKLLTEQGLDFVSRTGELSHTVLRISNPYGPGQVMKHGQGVIPAIVAACEQASPFYVIGDGSSVRDYVFIDDVVAAIHKTIARRSLTAGERLNIGSGRGTSILDMVEVVSRLMQRRIEVRFTERTGTDVDRNVLDVSRAADLLDWRPEIPLEDGLRLWLRPAAAA